MAESRNRKPCAKCDKSGGITTCDGCEKTFCFKHIIEHRQELEVELDNIGQEHDSFRRDLEEEDAPSLLLSQIDRWEEESITKIQTAAKRARNELRRILGQTKNDIKISVDKIASELQSQRESSDYMEADLNRWSTALTNLRKLWKNPSAIQISEGGNTLDVIHLIKVFEKTQLSTSPIRTQKSEKCLSQSYESTQEVFDQAMNGIFISENGHLAEYTSKNIEYETIFGKTLYQCGVHEIVFRVEKKGTDNFFFGIVSSSQCLKERIFDASTANGWWGFDVPVVSGSNQKRCGTNILQSGDTVKLTLDCDNQQIRFENYRAKITLSSYINTRSCPFPWKIAISLSRLQDTLRIL